MAVRALLSYPSIRFVLVGVGNTALGYALFALILLAGAPPLLAIVAATALGAMFNFFSIGLIVFRNADPMLLPRFLAVYAAQCLINAGALDALARFGAPPLLAQFLLLPLLATGTYLAMKHWVFRG
ncbi:MAG: GtrA family protein [Sphingopyxis sp.]|nr:GtrA family protein [Sphingopyxis sp.]